MMMRYALFAEKSYVYKVLTLNIFILFIQQVLFHLQERR